MYGGLQFAAGAAACWGVGVEGRCADVLVVGVGFARATTAAGAAEEAAGAGLGAVAGGGLAKGALAIGAGVLVVAGGAV